MKRHSLPRDLTFFWRFEFRFQSHFHSSNPTSRHKCLNCIASISLAVPKGKSVPILHTLAHTPFIFLIFFLTFAMFYFDFLFPAARPDVSVSRAWIYIFFSTFSSSYSVGLASCTTPGIIACSHSLYSIHNLTDYLVMCEIQPAFILFLTIVRDEALQGVDHTFWLGHMPLCCCCVRYFRVKCIVRVL